MNSIVSKEEKTAFDETGYHVLRSALTRTEVDVLRDALAKVQAVPADHPYAASLTACDLPAGLRDEENPRGLWNGFDLPLFDDRFFDLALQRRN